MLILLAKILSVGVKPHFTQEIIEKTKLVNGISFIGVPISLFYAILFLFTHYFYFSFVFSVGAVLFGSTLFFTSWLGHRFSRNYVSVVAPLLFGFVNVITGKDAGFYLAFIVTTLPALIIFDTNKQSTFYIVLSFLILSASVVCQMYINPLYTISYSMMLMIINFSINKKSSIVEKNTIIKTDLDN